MNHIGATKKGARGAQGPPNKEQNWAKKEQSGAFCLDYIYMDATSQINAKKICHWSKVCHVTSLTLDFIGSTQIKTVHD